MAAEPQRSARILSTPPPRGLLTTGPYQLLEDLGPAPFGTAYLAVDTRIDRLVFLKAVHPARRGTWQEDAGWEILLDETEALKRISHRGIPQVLEIARHGDCLVVAFDLTEGPALREVLGRRERLDRTTLSDWGCQLLEILAAAHAQGILHRHLTEDEVIVTPQGSLVLTGFGLTQLVCPSTPPGQLAGELYTPQDDLYAVGCLLRRLAFSGGVCGSRGLGARDPLLRVLARATSLDPGARYESAEEMAEALREAGRAEAAFTLRMDATPDSRPLGRVAIFPQRFQKLPPPSAPQPSSSSNLPEEDGQGGDLWRALVLLVASLLLMSFVLTTGWLLMADGSSRPGAGPSVRSQAPVQPMGRPPALLSR